jgi:hypothetical protein
MEDKLIIGIVSAVGGGIFALLTAYMSGRFKMREMEFKRMLQNSRTRLSAANEKLNDVYIPMVSCVEQCYRNWYLYIELKDEGRKKIFFDSIDKIRALYENMVETGSVIYLVPDAREEIERLVRFLDTSKDTNEWEILVLKRMEGIGMRSITENRMSSRKLPLATAQLVVMRFLSFFSTKLFASKLIQISLEIRTACAPIEKVAFAEEFNRIIDVLRSSSVDIALYSANSGSEAEPDSKSTEQKNQPTRKAAEPSNSQ